MTISYELILADQLGKDIATLDLFESLEWSRRVNGVGAFTAVFARDNFDRDLFDKDRRLQIWRKPDDSDPQLLMVGFLRRLRRRSSGGKRIVIISGPDSNYLLSGRSVASDSGLPGSDKSGPADDVMKEYVDDAMGAAASSDRILTSGGFSVQADQGLAPTLNKSAPRLKLLRTLQELARSSANAGTILRFDVVNPIPSTFEFRTYINQRGLDRTHPDGSNPIQLSEESGTLSNPDLDQDWHDEVTFVYGGGQGQGAERKIVTAEDTARSASSIFGRREGWYNGSNYSITAALQSATDAALVEGRPERHFSADIIDTKGNRFGKDWSFGDRVTALFDTEQIDVEVTSVRGKVSSDGKETITARLEHVD